MKPLQLGLLLVASLSGHGCDFTSAESKAIDNIKSIVKGALIDGESAQFSDLKYYKMSDYGCGYVNAKNKLGGYVGKKKFIVSLAQKQVEFDPDRELPEPPRAPTYATIQSTLDFATRSAAWASAVDQLRSKQAEFDALVNEKCSDNPEKKEAKPVERNLIDLTPKVALPFEISTDRVPSDFRSADLKSIAAKIEQLTKPKRQTETTAEYTSRMSTLKYDPTPNSYETLYAIKIHTAPFDAQEMASYDADTEMVSVTFRGVLTDGLCRNNRVPDLKLEHPVICTVGNGVQLSISNKNNAFGRYIKNRKEYSTFANVEYDLKDSFKLPRAKVSELPPRYSTLPDKGLIVSALLVGTLVDAQKNPAHAGIHAVSGPVIPFNLKYVIYYNENNGEILAKRQISQ